MAIKLIFQTIPDYLTSEIKTDKIQHILNSLACFPPVCQGTTSAETEELVKIITVWIYLKDELNKKILAKQSHIHIIPRHNEVTHIVVFLPLHKQTKLTFQCRPKEAILKQNLQLVCNNLVQNKSFQTTWPNPVLFPRWQAETTKS